MKILFVQKVKALVGSEKYFLELIPELEKRGIQTEFICIYCAFDKEKTDLFIKAYRELGLKIHLLEIKNERQILKSVRFIKDVLSKGQFDLIHSHLIHSDLWCALLKRIYKIKELVVSTKHGYDEAYIAKYGFSAEHLKKNRYFRIVKYAEKYIHRSFAVSDGLRKLFLDAGFCEEGNISTIHHGFDLPDNPAETNEDFRYSSKQIVILGRIIPFKGHMHLVKALPKVINEIPELQLLIIGHGDDEVIDEIKNFSEENQITEHINFLGYRTNIYDYLVNSDLMIVPSIAEGFGLIFLEAMNAKLPLIGFDVPATNEIIVNEETGILIKPYDHALLADAIIKTLKDNSIRNTFSRNAYKRLKTYFSLDRMVSETIKFYHSSLDSFENKERE
jgi:glycosyltransferase involved in cell wall biosynthesis